MDSLVASQPSLISEPPSDPCLRQQGRWGQCNALAGNSACQALQPKFHLQNSHNVGTWREPTPQSCPLVSNKWRMCPYPPYNKKN